MKKNLIKSLTTLLIATVAISTVVILPKRDVEAATTNENIKKVCDIAKKENGYTGYSGKGNKYGKEIYQKYPDFYWGSKEYVDWCDVFVDWCMIRAFGYDSASKITNQGKGANGKSDNRGGAQTYDSSSHNSEAYYKQMGRLYYPSKDGIQAGDQVFFTWQHTGLVVDVDYVNSSLVYTVVEGNCSNNGNRCVKINKYTGTSKFRSFGRPNYIKISSESTSSPIIVTSGEQLFVMRLYKECLGRDADTEGLNYWVNRMRVNKTPAATIVWEFFNSKEFKDHNFKKEVIIYRLYKAVLNRKPDDDGQAYWLRVFDRISYKSLVQGFVNNDEFGGICRNLGITRGTL